MPPIVYVFSTEIWRGRIGRRSIWKVVGRGCPAGRAVGAGAPVPDTAAREKRTNGLIAQLMLADLRTFGGTWAVRETVAKCALEPVNLCTFDEAPHDVV